MRSRVRFGVLAPVMVMVVCSAVLLTLPSRSAVGQEVEAGTGNISGQGEVEAGTGNTADFSGGVDRGGYPGGEDTGGFDQTAGRPDRLGTTPDTPHGTFSHALEGTGRTDVPAEAFSGGVTGSESDALFGSVFFMDIPEFQIVVKRGKVYSYEEVLQINAPGVTILGFPDLETFALSRFQGQIVATDISSLTHVESFDAFQKGFVDALLDQHVAPEARAGIRDAIERGLSIQDNIIDDVLGFIEGYPVNSFSDHVGDENIQRDATIGVGDAWSYSNYDHGMWLEASPAVIEPGEQTTISLHGQHDLSRNHRCDGLRSHPGFKPRELGKPITLSQDTTFRYHCYETGESGVEDLTLSITVVVAPEPEATLSASRETIEVGQSVTLNWRSQHAQQCRGGLIAARDVESPWPGTKTLSGSMTVTPQINTTYVLACEGRGGVSGEAVTVQVTGTVLESDLRANATLEQIEHTRVSAINSGIHVYEEPRGDAHVHDVMPMGARGTILSSEPITIAGQSFHKIRFDNGVEGWVREGGVIRDSNEELRRRVPRAAGCHRIRSMLVSLPEGYGAPFNFFSEAKEPTIRTICDETGAYLSVGTGMDNEFIFHRGLEWRDGSWKPLRLTGAKKAAGGQWIVGKAERFVDRRNTESQEPHFVLAYTCTWNDGAWRCGCRNEQCARPHWQLQVIRE